MKRLLILGLLCAAACFAQSPSATWTATGTGATAATAAYETQTGKAASIHTLAVIVTGSPSVCTVRIEGSLDGTNYFDLSGSQVCTSNVMFHVAGKPVTYARANIVTWTGGTNAVISYRGSN